MQTDVDTAKPTLEAPYRTAPPSQLSAPLSEILKPRSRRWQLFHQSVRTIIDYAYPLLFLTVVVLLLQFFEFHLLGSALGVLGLLLWSLWLYDRVALGEPTEHFDDTRKRTYELLVTSELSAAKRFLESHWKKAIEKPWLWKREEHSEARLLYGRISLLLGAYADFFACYEAEPLDVFERAEFALGAALAGDEERWYALLPPFNEKAGCGGFELAYSSGRRRGFSLRDKCSVEDYEALDRRLTQTHSKRLEQTEELLRRIPHALDPWERIQIEERLHWIERSGTTLSLPATRALLERTM